MLQMNRNTQDSVWHILSKALLECWLAGTKYPNESLCVFNKRLVVLSFMYKLSFRILLISAESCINRSSVTAAIFARHTVINLKEQRPSHNSLLFYCLSTASWISAGQNTTNHVKTNCDNSFYSFWQNSPRFTSTEQPYSWGGMNWCAERGALSWV